MSRLLDPKFRYVPACGTDLRKTFARVRRELRAQAAAKQQQPVVQLKRRTAR